MAWEAHLNMIYSAAVNTRNGEKCAIKKVHFCHGMMSVSADAALIGQQTVWTTHTDQTGIERAQTVGAF